MSKQPPSPVSAEQLASLQQMTQQFSQTQLAWLSGYFWGRVTEPAATQSGDLPQPAPQSSITLVSASQTGNARRLAEQLRDDLLAAGLRVKLVNAADYKFKQIADEQTLIIVTSTQGEGEAPEEAVAFYKYLHSKKAPALPQLSFAVFSLGDSSYEFFCQAGKAFDGQLAALGAKRLLDRVDADVDYAQAADAWRATVVSTLRAQIPASSTAALSQVSTGSIDQIISTPYSREAPFTATLAVNQKITGRDSDRDIRHLEIDLGQSDLRYSPGDALGIWFTNPPALIEELLQQVDLNADTQVEVNGQSMTIAEALRCHFEFTVNSSKLVENYAKLSGQQSLLDLLDDRAAMQHYAAQWPLIDMIRQAPVALSAEQLLSLLRPLTPRLYSIASSQAETADEVHLTLGVVRYQVEGRTRSGGASGFLADLQEDDEIQIFIEHNEHFRLPVEGNAPVIMIGPGTGIAPFRSFIQQRDNDGATGKNWLFFGNPHFTEDFLYQVEWQNYLKQGVVSRIDLAWSRDQAQKIYVQDKLREQGAEVWRWIQEGAYLYVCGDASRMAKDVEQALLEIISQHGAMESESADEFLSELRLNRRYQRDVY